MTRNIHPETPQPLWQRMTMASIPTSTAARLPITDEPLYVWSPSCSDTVVEKLRQNEPTCVNIAVSCNNDTQTKRLFRALADNTNVQRCFIQFGRRVPTNDSVARLVGTCISRNPSLRECQLHFSEECNDEAVSIIFANMFRETVVSSSRSTSSPTAPPHSLQKLTIQNGVGTIDGAIFGTLVESNNTPEYLLFYTGIYGDAVEAIGGALATNRSIRKLQFRDCFYELGIAEEVGGTASTSVPIRAGIALGNALRINTFLHELDLAHCNLCAESVNKLLAGLRHNDTLRILNLAGNRIGDQGAMYLSCWLSEKERMGVGENSHSDMNHENDGSGVTVRTIRSTCRLKSLCVDKCRIMVSGSNALCESIQGNPFLSLEKIMVTQREDPETVAAVLPLFLSLLRSNHPSLRTIEWRNLSSGIPQAMSSVPSKTLHWENVIDTLWEHNTNLTDLNVGVVPELHSFAVRLALLRNRALNTGTPYETRWRQLQLLLPNLRSKLSLQLSIECHRYRDQGEGQQSCERSWRRYYTTVFCMVRRSIKEIHQGNPLTSPSIGS